jgi:diguanylate cyclase (GGDEF)-like protein
MVRWEAARGMPDRRDGNEIRLRFARIDHSERVLPMNRRFPMPPGVMGQVITATANPRFGAQELSTMITKEAVLTAQLLKIANSGLYALHRPITTVERAIALLGTRAVRNAILTLSIRNIVPKSKLGGLPLDDFWVASLRRGAASKSLNNRLGLGDPDESFTVGICQDLGMLMNVQDTPALASRMSRILYEPAEARLRAEREFCRQGHPEVGSALFEQWQLPESLRVSIRFHHDPDEAPEEYRQHARLAAAAETISDMMLKDRTAEQLHQTMEQAAVQLTELGLNRDIIRDTVTEVGELVEEFSELIGLRAGPQVAYDEILAIVSEGLFRLNLSYEQLASSLKSSLSEAEHMTKQLSELNREFEQVARTDVLTGLPNRRSFDEALIRELAQAERQEAPLSLLLVDLDWFKRVNDTHGHQAGDRLLQQVGHAIASCVRCADTVARYGGEEFAVILPFTDATGGRRAAERLRRAIAAIRPDLPGHADGISASVGGASLACVGRANNELASALVDRADQELYRAKSEGRNRTCWARKGPPAVS